MCEDDLEPGQAEEKPELALQKGVDLLPMRVNPESEHDEKGEKKEHRHRKDRAEGEIAHQARENPRQKNRGRESAEELKVGDKGGASSRIGDDKSIAHAAKNTEVDVDQADDKKHEPK
jgi:hypothetical protein